MNYTLLKDALRAEVAELLEHRANLRIVSDAASNFEYAKITGQIIATYRAIIMVQEAEIVDIKNGGELNVR